MLAKTTFLYLASFIGAAVVAQADENVVTWTKPGARYRARSATSRPVTMTVTDTQTTVSVATVHVRSLSSPVKRSVKRAFLSTWSYQGCIADNENLPPMISPFPYQLATEDVSGASCMHFCDKRGSTLAAVENGNECWCGEASAAYNVSLVDHFQCNVTCAGQPNEWCGGMESLTYYTKA